MPKRRSSRQTVTPQRDGRAVVADVLAAAHPRPAGSDSQTLKNQYAVRFADRMAECIARDLSDRFVGISATPTRAARSVHGTKQLDVNFSTPQVGLGLGISLKSVHLCEETDGVRKRYTHNMKRNEEELRIEASGYHKRQPYAVMIGVLFLPFDSCEDAKRNNPSSFGSWVRHLRPYAGRDKPDDELDKFERIFIALYEPDATDMRFFDVQRDPPKNGRPGTLFTYGEFLDAAYHTYLRRNAAEFRWAEGDEEPLEIEDEGGEDDAEA